MTLFLQICEPGQFERTGQLRRTDDKALDLWTNGKTVYNCSFVGGSKLCITVFDSKEAATTAATLTSLTSANIFSDHAYYQPCLLLDGPFVGKP